ncbi:MAG: peptide ABC transporter substrate-binding protein [Anaerolineales bacterium]|nr:peptide ABC transporter substrate-binding protein [Anaerolineales bacterium]
MNFKKVNLYIVVLMVVGLLLSACQSPNPEVIEKEVTKIVKETVVVEGEPETVEVEVEVTKIVETEKEVVVTATPEPIPQVLRLLEGTALYLDPGRSGMGDGLHIMYNMFRGLVWVDIETGKLEPACAESWSVSDDGLVWTFHLREDLTWSDGQPLTAEDFRYAWLRNLDPEINMYAYLPLVGADDYSMGENTDPNSVGLVAVDDYTLEATCVDACPTFAKQTATLTLMPLRKDIIEEYGDDWIQPENIVVNGPFTLESWTPDIEVVLKPNENYWGEPAKLDQVIFTLVEDIQTSCMLFYPAGQVDACWADLSELPRLQEDPALKDHVVNLGESRTVWLGLDTTNPPLDDLRVRKALALAIDKDIISQVVSKGAYQAAVGIFPPMLNTYTKDVALEGDLATAQQLLADAGYPGGEGLRDIDLVFVSGGGGSEYQMAAEVIQSMWKENLGVNVKLEPIERSAFYDWIRGKSEMAWDIDFEFFGSDFEDPSAYLNQLFPCAVDFWSTHWCNEEFDDLISRASVELDPDTRVDMYKQAEQMFISEVPIIPMWHSSVIYLVNPKVQDLEFERLLNWNLVHKAYISE